MFLDFWQLQFTILVAVLWILNLTFNVLMDFEQFCAELGVVRLKNLTKLSKGYIFLRLQDKMLLLVLCSQIFNLGTH